MYYLESQAFKQYVLPFSLYSFMIITSENLSFHDHMAIASLLQLNRSNWKHSFFPILSPPPLPPILRQRTDNFAACISNRAHKFNGGFSTTTTTTSAKFSIKCLTMKQQKESSSSSSSSPSSLSSGGRIGGSWFSWRSAFKKNERITNSYLTSNYLSRSSVSGGKVWLVVWFVVWFVVVSYCLWLIPCSIRSKAEFLLSAFVFCFGACLFVTEETSVLKLQVGFLGLDRSLQSNLNRIAEVADTSTPEGLSYVLAETTIALLRQSDYCISGYSSVDIKRSLEDVEKRFNQLSNDERGKYDEETLVNVNNIKSQNTTIQRASGFSNEYIVVTILVAAGGAHKLPTIKRSTDLNEALLKLGSILSNKLLAVEVLWTPQNENDTLSKGGLLKTFPLLRPL